MNLSHTLPAGLLTVAVLCAAGAVLAQDRIEAAPAALLDIGITERSDNQIPLDAVFRDEEGREVTLGQYFDGERPVILNLMYMACPMLCGLVGNGLNDAMKQLEWTAGEAFTVLSLSFDPTERPSLAKIKKLNYIDALERPEAAAGWHFLTGSEEQIRRLTDAVGFHFKWIEARKEFAHAAAIMILTPDGRVSRYIYGVVYDPQTVRLSLVEAAEGKIGTTKDRFLLFCFHYDSATGRYGPAAQRIMSIGGALTVIILAVWIFMFWRRDRRRRREVSPDFG